MIRIDSDDCIVSSRTGAVASRSRANCAAIGRLGRPATLDRDDHERLAFIVVGRAIGQDDGARRHDLHHLKARQVAELERQQTELFLNRRWSERDACERLANDRVGIDRQRAFRHLDIDQHGEVGHGLADGHGQQGPPMHL